jgi:hypothetical protein
MNDLLAMLLSWVPVQRDETRHVRKGSDSDKSAFLDHFRFALYERTSPSTNAMSEKCQLRKSSLLCRRILLD